MDLWCDYCRRADESTMHALRDCPKVAIVLPRLLPHSYWVEFFKEHRVKELLDWNLQQMRILALFDGEWHSTYKVACHWI